MFSQSQSVLHHDQRRYGVLGNRKAFAAITVFVYLKAAISINISYATSTICSQLILVASISV